ncbi:hypothetical protein [Vreelandella alkaliphila]|uniref:hypothetical protein n=1 Tax=Vreelandella alkaliphila TaxID=272774 RepID=UPI003FD8EA20
MGRFSDRLSEVARNSRFTQLELESIFTPEEEEVILEVKEALASASDDNEASVKIQNMGEKAIKVLTKLGKKALLG